MVEKNYRKLALLGSFTTPPLPPLPHILNYLIFNCLIQRVMMAECVMLRSKLEKLGKKCSQKLVCSQCEISLLNGNVKIVFHN